MRVLPLAVLLGASVLLASCTNGEPAANDAATARPSPASAVGSPSLSPSPPPSTPPSATATAQPRTGPVYDPGAERCRDAPRPALDRQWQTALPRSGETVAPTEPVRIGLRNKFGDPQETYVVTVKVDAPGGGRATARTEVNGDQWADVLYPRDFTGAPEPRPSGTYTVVWESREGFLVCDGFVVG